jgi:ubiquinone/menaquinone biosynthesis C-methylase UbiE
MHDHVETQHGPAAQAFVPGLGKAFLTRLYDPVSRLMGVRSMHDPLLDQAAVRPGEQVLEIGCGTANVALEVKRRQAGAEVHALDPDPVMLARARRKAARQGVEVEFTQGYAQALPYPDAAFDHVLSAFMLHHLDADARHAALCRVARVLRPGGSLHLVDFGGAQDSPDGWMARRMRHSERLADHYDGRIPKLMVQAGLVDAREVAHRATRFGPVTYYAAAAGS